MNSVHTEINFENSSQNFLGQSSNYYSFAFEIKFPLIVCGNDDLIWRVRNFSDLSSAVKHVNIDISSTVIHYCFIDNLSMLH